jgi:hypothetical protein
MAGGAGYVLSIACLPKLKSIQPAFKPWRDKLAKKKEVAISSEPVYKKPPEKIVKKPTKPVK